MRPVRPILTTLVLASLPMLATEPAFETTVTGTVSIELNESVQIHPRVNDLQSTCGAAYAVNGCTAFPNETLECRCRQRGNAWFIDATARLDAMIHLPNTFELTRLRAHEQMHLTDLGKSLKSHLESITSLAFVSLEACELRAGFVSNPNNVHTLMNRLRAESNAKLGCDREGAMRLREGRSRPTIASSREDGPVR